jgi:hypothetical protein
MKHSKAKLYSIPRCLPRVCCIAQGPHNRCYCMSISVMGYNHQTASSRTHSICVSPPPLFQTSNLLHIDMHWTWSKQGTVYCSAFANAMYDDPSTLSLLTNTEHSLRFLIWHKLSAYHPPIAISLFAVNIHLHATRPLGLVGKRFWSSGLLPSWQEPTWYKMDIHCYRLWVWRTNKMRQHEIKTECLSYSQETLPLLQYPVIWCSEFHDSCIQRPTRAAGPVCSLRA